MREIDKLRKWNLKSKNIFEILFILCIIIFVNNQKVTNNLLGMFDIQINTKILQELLRSNDDNGVKKHNNNISSNKTFNKDILESYDILEFNIINNYTLITLLFTFLIIIAYFIVGIMRSIYNKSRKRIIYIYT